MHFDKKTSATISKRSRKKEKKGGGNVGDQSLAVKESASCKH